MLVQMTRNENTEAYNKTVQSGDGTLMGNWQEEQIFRAESGIPRTQPKNHLVKRHEDLFLKPYEELHLNKQKGDDTFYRTLGARKNQGYSTTTGEIGADLKNIRHPGISRRTQLIEKQMLQDIDREIAEIQRKKEEAENFRELVTTKQLDYSYKGPSSIPVGRRVIKDLDGNFIPPSQRDDDLMVDFGMRARPQINTDKEIREMIVPNNYAQDVPITFYTEKLHDGNFYMSKPAKNTPSPFGLNNQFLKTFHQYKHYND